MLSDESDKIEPASRVVIADVVSLSLGIETAGGVMTKIIDRQTSVPITKSQVFFDVQGQSAFSGHPGVRRGASMAKDNRLLGKFMLDGIPPAPRGVPQIEVTFHVDANQILTVKAVEKGTNREKEITIQNETGRLSEEEIDEMVAEAERWAEEDSHRQRAG
eukprot:Sspe_Gene.30836::Locus_15229_Transcript_2_2_Confidence_0.400_Length_2383::g.30836::m.30836